MARESYIWLATLAPPEKIEKPCGAVIEGVPGHNTKPIPSLSWYFRHNMSNTINDFHIYKTANNINDDSDNYSNVINYVSKSMTLMELMETLQEIFERFPFAKNYKIHHIAFGSLTPSTCVSIDKTSGVITIS